MNHGDLPKVHVGTLLVLPDHAIRSAVLAYPRVLVVNYCDIKIISNEIMSVF
jgi:hypothetical protein